MDQFDKIKGAWKSQDYSKEKVSTIAIYKMLHAKSSSYVKWIFYISIIEFIVMNSLVLFRDNSKDLEMYKQMGLYDLVIIITIISYIVVFGFIYAFYRNYKNIKADHDAKTLMDNIIKTRKTVKYYIYFNIGFMALSTAILFYNIFSTEQNIKLYKEAVNVPLDFSTFYLLTAIIIFMILLLGLILLIYRLIYGILLKRLKKNHKELEQLDK